MKNIIWITVIAVVVWVAWYFNKDLFAATTTKASGTNTVGASGGGSTTTTSTASKNLGAGTFPIKEGDRSESIRIMQQALNSRWGSTLVLDGIYGPKTRQSLSAHGFNTSVSYAEYLEVIGTNYFKNLFQKMVV